jgi:hypothetical protein
VPDTVRDVEDGAADDEDAQPILRASVIIAQEAHSWVGAIVGSSLDTLAGDADHGTGGWVGGQCKHRKAGVAQAGEQ